MPDDTPAELEEALRRGQRHLHGFGITAWQDAIVEPQTEERAYVTLASRGELTGRVVGAMWWERSRGGEQIEEFVERRRTTSIGRYRATSVKLMMDGVLENFTGAMLEPYGDGKGGTTDNRGLLQIDPDGLSDVGAQARLRSGSSRTSTRSATALCGPRSTRSRRHVVRMVPRTRVHTSRTSRSSTRTTSRGSGSSTWPPTPSRSGRRTTIRSTS